MKQRGKLSHGNICLLSVCPYFANARFFKRAIYSELIAPADVLLRRETNGLFSSLLVAKRSISLSIY